MASREFADVALQSRRAHPRVGATVAALHHAPERFHAVDMSLVVHVLAYTVPHSVTVAQARLAAGLIRVHVSVVGYPHRSEAVQVGLAGARHHDGADLPRPWHGQR